MAEIIDSLAQGAAIRAIDFCARNAKWLAPAWMALCLLGLWLTGPEPL